VQAAKISNFAGLIEGDAKLIIAVQRLRAKYVPATPTIVWTMPSSFSKVTVVPGLTVKTAGVNAKLSMTTFA
jgi:hypothetical protein